MADDSNSAIDFYSSVAIKNYCAIGASAMLWFDFLTTIDMEYHRIWERKFTGATLVYVGIRYAAVISRIFLVLELFLWNISDKACGGLMRTSDALNLINDFALSAFTCLRVYGIWGRNWEPLVAVLPVVLSKPALEIYVGTIYSPGQGGPQFGCLPDYSLSVDIFHIIETEYYAFKAIPIASEAIIIILTWIKTLGILRLARQTGMRTPLAALLFRDGTVYFLFTLMAQLPILVPTPDQYAAIWAIWQGVAPVFTNIAVARLILNLRGVYFADSTGGEGETSLHLSSMRFRGLSSANIVGNLGATLMLPSNSAELTGIPFDARRPSDNARSRSGPAQPDEMSASEAVDINDAWDLEDETPEYCDDPFLRGMREAVTADSTGEIMMPLSHC